MHTIPNPRAEAALEGVGRASGGRDPEPALQDSSRTSALPPNTITFAGSCHLAKEMCEEAGRPINSRTQTTDQVRQVVSFALGHDSSVLTAPLLCAGPTIA